MKTKIFAAIACFFCDHKFGYESDYCLKCNKKAVGLPEFKNPPKCPPPKNSFPEASEVIDEQWELYDKLIQ